VSRPGDTLKFRPALAAPMTTHASLAPLHSGHGGPIHPDLLGAGFLLLGVLLIGVGAYRLYTYEEPSSYPEQG